MVEKTSKKTAPAAKGKTAPAAKGKAAPKGSQKGKPKEVALRMVPNTTGNNALHAIKATRRKGNLTAAMLRLMGPLLEGVVRYAALNMGANKTAKLIHFQNSQPASGSAHSLDMLRIEAAKKASKPKKAPKPKKDDAPEPEAEAVQAAEGGDEMAVDAGAAAVEVTVNE